MGGDYSIAYQVGGVTGIVILVVLATAVVGRAYRRGFGGPRWVDGVAAVAAVGIAILAGSHLVGDQATQKAKGTSWSSQKGLDMHAGFVDGCDRNGTLRDFCECTFSKVSSDPGYDTPDEFEHLAPDVQRYEQTRDPADIPTVMVDAVSSCRPY